MVYRYQLDDGTWLVPHLIHDMEDEYFKDAELEKNIIAQARYDKKYKDDEKHQPFIDDALIGCMTYRALIVPGTEQESRAVRNEIDRKQKKKGYHNRCRISDGKGGLKQCPEKIPNPDYGKVENAPKEIANRCDMCPIHRAWRDKGRLESYEDMTSNDYNERKDREKFSNGMVSHKDILERVGKILLDVTADKNSRAYKVVWQMLMGKEDADGDDGNTSINQVCKDLGFIPSRIYKALQSKKIRDAVLDAISNDPFIEIEKLL